MLGWLYTYPAHCNTAEAHVLLNFKSVESGPMTNVRCYYTYQLLSQSFESLPFLSVWASLALLSRKKSGFDTIMTTSPLENTFYSYVLDKIFFSKIYINSGIFAFLRYCKLASLL
jgi:hypothetical protein